jgi:hypothetical protein
MVVVHLIGGLGNQIAQYAFGLSLANRLNTRLVLNTGLLENSVLAKALAITPRTFELDIFGIEHPKSNAVMAVVKLITAKLLPGRVMLRDSDIDAKGNWYSTIEKATEVHCLGYFHSESYYTHIESELRQKLIFRKSVSAQTAQLNRQINSTHNPVFLHVRRGDYLTNAKARETYVSLREDYYANAIKLMKETVSNLHFFIFSDDPAWVKSQFGRLLESNATFVNHNADADSWQDMYSMSQCQNGITANSSFSWWGAWLISNQTKVIITPKTWFLNQSNEGVLPKTWMILEN